MEHIEDKEQQPNVLAQTTPEPDLMESLMSRAREKLEEIGLVGMEHIISAFKDKDTKGRRLTSIEIREDYWDAEEKKILYSRSRLVSMAPEIQLERSGGYTTVILQFDEAGSPDMERIWAVLTEYGKTAMKGDEQEAAIPVLTLTAVPMTLGGSYGMTAMDPLYYTLQPAEPSETACRQIRLLYQPESVLFLRDDSFQTEDVIAKVKSELAGERLAEETWIKKKKAEEEFKKQHEEDMAQYLENGKYVKHTFRSTKQI